jgi:hypothetical protein
MARLYHDSTYYNGRYVFDYALPGDPPNLVINHDTAEGKWWGGEVTTTQAFGRSHRALVGAEYKSDLEQEQKNYDESATGRVPGPSALIVDRGARSIRSEVRPGRPVEAIQTASVRPDPLVPLAIDLNHVDPVAQEAAAGVGRGVQIELFLRSTVVSHHPAEEAEPQIVAFKRDAHHPRPGVDVLPTCDGTFRGLRKPKECAGRQGEK